MTARFLSCAAIQFSSKWRAIVGTGSGVANTDLSSQDALRKKAGPASMKMSSCWLFAAGPFSVCCSWEAKTMLSQGGSSRTAKKGDGAKDKLSLE